MARAQTIPTLSLVSPASRSKRPEPGVYLVQVKADGDVEIERLPDSAMLIDAAAWASFWDALKALSPMVAKREL